MRLTAIILLSASMVASAGGHTQGISLAEKNAPLQKVFKTIEKQTGYTFFFENKLLQKAKKVDVVVSNASLQQVLDLCFKDQPLQYNIVDKTIVVTEKEKSPNDHVTLSGDEVRPPIDVTGKVTDADGNPLVGASVKVKGSSKGTTTNNDGVFVLKGVADDAVLEISYVGFEMINIPVNSRTSIVTSLKAKPENLGEVIINKGYYSEKQRYTVGNASHVDSKAIEESPVQNPILAMQGRVPGIEITQSNGLPGGATTIRIQGRNSIQSGLDPLIVIDGVPFPSQLANTSMEGTVQGGSPLNYVNPSDIESIDVLKDADATAIYGSRAANGAILITTKKGKVGKTKVNVNLQQGSGRVGHFVDMMNTRQYLDMRYEAFKNDGLTADPSSDYDLTLWDTTRYTNWQKTLIGGTAHYTNIGTSVSGGTEIMQYLIGGTYNRQTTVFPGSYDDKKGGLYFNVGGSTNNKRFNIQLSGNYMYDQNHLPGVDLTNPAIVLEPDAPPLYNPDGSLNWAPDAAGSSTWRNPLANHFYSQYNNTTKNLVTSLNLSYDILDGLKIKSSFGYNNLLSDIFRPQRLEVNRPENIASSQRVASIGTRNMNSWVIEPQLQYSKRISKGKFDGLIGVSVLKNTANVLTLRGSGYPSDLLMQTLTAAKTITAASSSQSISRFNALFARINYTWQDKYIVDLTARRDGSSKFGDANKLHNFGSAGLAWIFTDESYLQKTHFLSFGKLRASYGTTGNDQIGDFQHLSLYGIQNPTILYQGAIGLQPTIIPNPNLQWEETRKLQGGVDLGFFYDRINLNVTYARNRSTNQLISYIVPSTTGFTSITENFPALVQNTSWEIGLSTTNLKNGQIKWNTSFNLTIPRNKLVSFPGIEKTGYADGFRGVIVGQPLGIQKVYHYIGVDSATGLYQISDNKGNPVPFPSYPNDYNKLVDLTTRLYGGISNTFTYKGFQLDFLFQFVRQPGPKLTYYYNGTTAPPGLFDPGLSNQPVAVLNRWQKPGDVTPIAKFTTGTSVIIWQDQSDAWNNYDASFIRLKNLSLAWQIPAQFSKKIGLQTGRFYFQGQNLLTFTKYTGLDPETKSITSLPLLRMLTFGVQVEF